jgi:glycosyltransferase involved in cell wall biosynthesis
MNIVYVSYEDTVGRRFNGFDLCEYLLAHGDQCAMYIRLRSTMTSFLFNVWPNGVRSKIREKTANLERLLSIQNILYPPALFYRKFIRSADLVHLHLISMEYLNFLEFIPLSWMKPIVLSLHEFSPFTGCCAYPAMGCNHWQTGCHSCEDLNGLFPLRKDRTPFLWRYKYFVWNHVRPTVIVASRWMMEKVNNSPMFNECPKHLIPFGLDLNTFSPGDKLLARRELGIPKDNFVIFFRALVSPYKGLETIKSALRILRPKSPVTIVSLNGVGQLDEFIGCYHLIEIDYLRSNAAVAQLFRASDIFLMPSLQETFGMMAMEAMACAVPSVVTQGTPLEEVTRSPQAALTIPPNDPEALALAISRLMEDPEFRHALGDKARQLAEELYDFNQYARRIRETYIDLLDKNNSPKGDLRRTG